MVAVWRRPLGRSLLWLVTPKFLSRSGAPHPPRIPAPARDRREQESGQGCPRPSPSPQPGPGNVTCPALPAPGRRVPGAESDRAGGSSSSCSPGAQRGAPTAERSPGAEVRHPRGDAEPRGRGPESGQEGARSGPLSPPARPPARTPRPRCRGQARQRPPSAGPGSVTRAASAINNPQPAPGAPPVTPDPRGGAAGETMTRCTRQPSC